MLAERSCRWKVAALRQPDSANTSNKVAFVHLLCCIMQSAALCGCRPRTQPTCTKMDLPTSEFKEAASRLGSRRHPGVSHSGSFQPVTVFAVHRRRPLNLGHHSKIRGQRACIFTAPAAHSTQFGSKTHKSPDASGSSTNNQSFNFTG